MARLGKGVVNYLVGVRINHSDHTQLTMLSLGTVIIDRVCVVDGDQEGACRANRRRLVIREECTGRGRTGGIEGSLCNTVVLLRRKELLIISLGLYAHNGLSSEAFFCVHSP